MKISKLLPAILLIPLVWSCSSKTRTASKPDDEVAVKEACLRVVTALRQCDRHKLQGLVTPKTWAIATAAKNGKEDLIDLMCKNTAKGDVKFEDVTIDEGHASLSVKLGNQPPRNMEMSRIAGKWLLGTPGKAPVAVKMMPNRKPAIEPQMKSHRFEVTNLHLGTALIHGAGKGSHKTIRANANH